MSLMKIGNKIGPNTVPSGTSDVTVGGLDVDWFCSRLARWIIFYEQATLSNALTKSRLAMSTCFFLSIFLVMPSMVIRNCDSHGIFSAWSYVGSRAKCFGCPDGSWFARRLYVLEFSRRQRSVILVCDWLVLIACTQEWPHKVDFNQSQ